MHDLDHPVLASAKNTDNAGDAGDASDDGVDDHEASDGAAVVVGGRCGSKWGRRQPRTRGVRARSA
jgi:hypothetical protein